MKIVWLFFLLIIHLSFSFESEVEVSNMHISQSQIHDEENENQRICNDFASQIQQSNNTSTPTNIPITTFPAIIRVPGTYVLTQNVSVAANQSGITILTGGVVIDLNDFVITGATGSLDGILVVAAQSSTSSQSGTNTTAHNITNAGINNNSINNAINNTINNQLTNINNVNNLNNTNNTNNAAIMNNTFARAGRNITIRNGTIQTMGRNGILVTATANSGFNSQFINLENLQILNCGTTRSAGTGANGISINGGIDFNISNCLLSRNSNIGLLISGNQNNLIVSQNFVIENCISSFNLNDGFQFNNCSNYTIKNILAFNNGLNSGTGGSGIVQKNGSGMNFAHCQAYGNRFNGISSTGNNHIFINCQSDVNNLAGFIIGGNNNSLYNCSAIQNSTQGFNISGNNNSFETCEAKSNGNNPNAATPAGTTVAGFLTNGSCHTLLDNISSSNNGTGILLSAGSSTCQIRNNTVNCNTTAGIRNLGTNNRVYANYASDNSSVTANNYIGVTNVSVSPSPATIINFTTNISN